jgi:hypothetical protein
MWRFKPVVPVYKTVLGGSNGERRVSGILPSPRLNPAPPPRASPPLRLASRLRFSPNYAQSDFQPPSAERRN